MPVPEVYDSYQGKYMTRAQAEKVMNEAAAAGFTALNIARRVNGGRNPWCVIGRDPWRGTASFWTKQDWERCKEAMQKDSRI